MPRFHLVIFSIGRFSLSGKLTQYNLLIFILTSFGHVLYKANVSKYQEALLDGF